MLIRIARLGCARRIALLLISCCLAPAHKLTFQIIGFKKPEVSVSVQHPAQAGVQMQGKKIAFGQITGPCADQFSDLLESALQQRGTEIVNRQHMSAVLAEHRFQVSSSVDPSTAVEIGKLLGPSMMMFVSVSRCGTENKLLYEDQFSGPRINVSRTEGHFLASVHTVDLATGRELPTRPVDVNLKRENRSTTGIPEYPSEVEVLDEAVRLGAGRVEHLYFPWTETRSVAFMNSRECNLKQAYAFMKAGDYNSALSQSKENVEACKSDPKTNHQADAWYNLGVAYMVLNSYEEALSALQQANRLHSDRYVQEAMRECLEAKTGAEAVASSQARQTSESARAKAEEQKRVDASAATTLTNESIVKMVKGGLSDDVIVHMINTQPGKFNLTTDDMIGLKRAGVDDKVITAMLDKH